MPADRWLRGLDSLLDNAAACDGEPGALRDLTFGVFRHIEGGRHEVHAAFQSLREAEITSTARDFGADLIAGRFKRPETPDALDGGVELAARLLRGLEAALITLGSHARGRPKASEFAVAFGQDEGWLLPFTPRFRGDDISAERYFAKRGLARHRCIPKRLDTGHQIDLHLIDQRFGEELHAAAGLFESLELLDSRGEVIGRGGPFRAAAIQRAPDGAVEDILKSVCETTPAPQILVFPELSLRPEDREEIVRLLRTVPWDVDLSGPRPSLVVAGSWHDVITQGAEAGGVHNAAPVYDGFGNAVGRHLKHAPYWADGDDEKLVEDIVVGTKILVLASRSLTVAVAICLDFCQTSTANPYDELDVDLVLVTSLADGNTTGKHAAQADRIWQRRRTATFLAQQDIKPSYGVAGAKPYDQTFADSADRPLAVRKFAPPA